MEQHKSKNPPSSCAAQREKKENPSMEVTEYHRSPQPPPGGAQTFPAARYSSEDILFCIDVGPETMSDMKVNGPNGRPYTRLDSIKQAILLFIHAKLAINPDHRFAFSALSKSTYWLRKEFSSEVDSAVSALRGISVDSTSSQADLTQLFRVATHEAKKSRAQNRIFRVILLYCRSSMPPQYQLPSALNLFTLDAMYLHDRPGPGNCPQKVFDALVEASERISEFEGYLFESGQGLARALFRHISVLLCHPQQRHPQHELKRLGIPKLLVKETPSPAVEGSKGGDIVVVSSSQ